MVFVCSSFKLYETSSRKNYFKNVFKTFKCLRVNRKHVKNSRIIKKKRRIKLLSEKFFGGFEEWKILVIQEKTKKIKKFFLIIACHDEGFIRVKEKKAFSCQKNFSVYIFNFLFFSSSAPVIKTFFKCVVPKKILLHACEREKLISSTYSWIKVVCSSLLKCCARLYKWIMVPLLLCWENSSFLNNFAVSLHVLDFWCLMAVLEVLVSWTWKSFLWV